MYDHIKLYDAIFELTNLSRIQGIVLCAFISRREECQDFRWLSKLCNVNRRTIERTISKLIKEGYLRKKKISHNEIVPLLKAKKLSGKGIGEKVCKWCGIKTTLLFEHHYPLTRRKGGKKTIKICSNCHTEYHHGWVRIEIDNENLVENLQGTSLMPIERT